MNIKVYVGNISSEANEEALKNLFISLAGVTPTSITFRKNSSNRNVQSHAFVSCVDRQAVDKSIKVLDGYSFMGESLRVQQYAASKSRRGNGSGMNGGSNLTCRVQLHGVPGHTTKADITSLLSTFGNVTHVERRNDGPSFCRYIATYEFPEQAAQAVKQLQDYPFEGRCLRVDFFWGNGGMGHINGGGGGDYMGRGNNTHVSRLPPQANRNYHRLPSNTDFPLKMLVISDMVGAIIGRSGATIRQITQQSRARVDVHRREHSSSTLEKTITIYGTPEHCSAACKRILQVMETEARNANRNDVALKIMAHNNLIGRIIGRGGATIKRIMQSTGTKIAVSASHDIIAYPFDRVITIRGDLDSMCEAEKLLSAKLRQSYESDMNALTHHHTATTAVYNNQPSGPATAGHSYVPPHNPPVGGYHRGGYPAQHHQPSGAYHGGGAGSYYAPPPPTQPMMYPGGGPGDHAGGPPPMMMPPPPPGPHHHQQQQQAETVYVWVPNSFVGAIIGTGGSSIREMINTSGASIKVQPTDEKGTTATAAAANDADDESGGKKSGNNNNNEGGENGSPGPTANERRVIVIGTPDAQWRAQCLLFRKVFYEGYYRSNSACNGGVGGGGAIATEPHLQHGFLRIEMSVPSNQVGRIIGKGGQTVKEIQRVSRAQIKLPDESQNANNPETPVYIIGDFYATQAAQRQIRLLVSRNQQQQNNFTPHNNNNNSGGNSSGGGANSNSSSSAAANSTNNGATKSSSATTNGGGGGGDNQPQTNGYAQSPQDSPLQHAKPNVKILNREPATPSVAARDTK